jgi:hypothetical protein
MLRTWIPLTRTRAVNLRTEQHDVYIGRAGHGHDGFFGNPFRLGEHEPRGATIQRYREWFLARIASDPEFRKRVLELKGKRLGCFCKPHACHGGVMAQWIDEQPEPAPAPTRDH